jgi:hypothetical protein
MGKSGNFVFTKQGNESISPAHYGYYSVKWAYDLTQASLDRLLKVECSKNGLISKIKFSQFPTELQYIALYIAAYLTYAFQVCNAPAAISNDMKRGVDDGIKDLRMPTGVPYDKELIDFLKGLIGIYFQTQTNDFDRKDSDNTFNIHGCEAAKNFVEMLCRSYSHSVNDSVDLLEVMTNLNAVIGKDVLLTYEAAQKHYGLAYRP